jgi:hypothetical protein
MAAVPCKPLDRSNAPQDLTDKDMKSFSLQKLLASLSLFAFCFIFPALAHAQDWRPVTSQELGMKMPQVEPDADAEVIFWEVRVDDSDPESMAMKHYIRVKIFTERGREKYSKVDIPFAKGIRIKDIQARVIKPDGSIVDLAKADVFDREIAKTDKIKVKAKSFAVPGIDIGVIVEYRYSEIYNYGSAEDMPMIFQHDVPIESIAYYFRPADNVRYLTFNMADNKFVKDKNGFYKAAMENVPAIKQEPQMPPEDEIRSWLLLYYSSQAKQTSMDFWARAGGYIARKWDIKDTLKPGKEVKAAASEITNGATTPEDQVEKIFEFCKTKVKNITFDTTLTDEQKEAIKPNKSTLDTYKKLLGTDIDINELFASLVTATGLEARLAFGGDRSKKFFDPSQAHESFIHFSAVAVKVNGRWQYYSPGDLFVPFGMLAWNEEDTGVLLLNNKDFITTRIAQSSEEKSRAKRTGRFKLSEDGTLDGTVTIEYTGQLANNYKLNNYKESQNRREEILKESVKARLSTAELSEIAIENVSDPEKPFVYKYHIKAPNYAQKTGKRLFLQPGYFEFGNSPLFSSASRKYSIFFHYPWSEVDDIEISLPKGFSLDNADSPVPIVEPSGVTALNIKMAISPDNVLRYKREFFFGSGGATLFPASAYAPIKGLFDAFNKADSHIITLKQN